MPADSPKAFGHDGRQIARLYRERFTPEELAFKRAMWRVFIDRYFQRFIGPDDVVVDLGAGTCEFINAIQCGERIAVDINPDVEQHVEGAKAVVAHSTDLGAIDTASVDVVFTSNFFEHLPDKAELVDTLLEVHRILRTGGRIMVLMPNIRYLPGRYWDYFDHHLALTQHSLVEVLALTGFKPILVQPKTLPYTIKHTRLPRRVWMVDAYMRLPAAWPLLGKQMFVVAERSELPDEDLD